MNVADIKSAQKDIESRRLAWRCRRGMLELDIVLQRFIATHLDDLSTQELVAFDALLALPDNDFWNKLQQPNVGLDASQQQVIDKLNAHE